MACALSRYVPVLYVDPARPALAASRRDRSPLGLTLGVVAPNVSRLSPVVLPGMTRAGIRLTTAPLVRHGIRRAVRALACDVSGIVVATVDDLLQALPVKKRVFYGTDDYVSGADLLGVPVERLLRAEARQLELATDVVAVSDQLLQRWSPSANRVHLLPNGCDVRHYREVDEVPPPVDVHLRSPIAGFVGHVNARIDLSLLEAVANRGVSLLMVGPVDPKFRTDRFNRLVSRDNVQWVGPRPFAALPSYLRLMHVGLTPYVDSAFNRGSFPLKTLEYLAAGRGVVSTDLPASRWLGTDLIHRAMGPREFAEATEAALAAPRGQALMAKRKAVAEQHSWAGRAAGMAAVLGLSATGNPP
jgi:teichuronic acid biosynthesis glycosyltransferase TuaH